MLLTMVSILWIYRIDQNARWYISCTRMIFDRQHPVPLTCAIWPRHIDFFLKGLASDRRLLSSLQASRHSSRPPANGIRPPSHSLKTPSLTKSVCQIFYCQTKKIILHHHLIRCLYKSTRCFQADAWKKSFFSMNSSDTNSDAVVSQSRMYTRGTWMNSVS